MNQAWGSSASNLNFLSAWKPDLSYLSGLIKHYCSFKTTISETFPSYIFHVNGGGGFFLACKDFWRMFDNSFPACIFFKVEISWHILIPLFRPGSVHNGSASLDNCDWVFSVSHVWARSLIGSHTMPGQRHSQPTLTCWVKVYAFLGVTCHLHFWQNDQGLLHTNVVTRGWNGHRIRVSTQEEKKILPPLLPGFERTTFWSQIWHSNQQAIPASAT